MTRERRATQAMINCTGPRAIFKRGLAGTSHLRTGSKQRQTPENLNGGEARVPALATSHALDSQDDMRTANSLAARNKFPASRDDIWNIYICLRTQNGQHVHIFTFSSTYQSLLAFSDYVKVLIAVLTTFYEMQREFK